MKRALTSEKIIILDFGSQYTQLIARRIREVGVYSEILPHNASFKKLTALNPAGLIMSGGPESVNTKKALKFDPKILDSDLPVLGICYGMQSMAQHFRGKVSASSKREFGNAIVKIYKGSIFAGLSNKTKEVNVWMSHGDTITTLPEGFEIITSTEDVQVAGYQITKEKTFAIQFHPEVYHSTDGKQLLSNFLVHICECAQDWTADSFVQRTVEDFWCGSFLHAS